MPQISLYIDKKTLEKIEKAAHSRNPIFHYGYRTILTHAPASLLRKQEAFLNDLSYLDGLKEN